MRPNSKLALPVCAVSTLALAGCRGGPTTAYLDGVPVLQATDAYYVSGGFGLRHDNTRTWPGMVSRFDLLRWGTY
ncbi:MAG TPA: hypothetical protein VHG93_29100 [Longimicrobium sp.]|nr:hypothetical protein [Longimicrobium sp.]